MRWARHSLGETADIPWKRSSRRIVSCLRFLEIPASRVLYPLHLNLAVLLAVEEINDELRRLTTPEAFLEDDPNNEVEQYMKRLLN